MAIREKAYPCERTSLPINLKRQVLIEAGYRCAVPPCRTILTLNLHHIYQVAEGGNNDPDNLIALCANCHGLYHTGVMDRAAISIYKAILVSLSRAFDFESVDMLLYLYKLTKTPELPSPIISGDTLIRFSGLIASNLIAYSQQNEVHRYDVSESRPVVVFTTDPDRGINKVHLGYSLSLTDKGKLLVKAWESGDREALRAALGVIPQTTEQEH